MLAWTRLKRNIEGLELWKVGDYRFLVCNSYLHYFKFFKNFSSANNHFYSVKLKYNNGNFTYTL